MLPIGPMLSTVWPLVPHERSLSNFPPPFWEKKMFPRFVLCEEGSPHTDDLFRSVWGRINSHRRFIFVSCEVGSPHTDDLFCLVRGGVTSHRRFILFCVSWDHLTQTEIFIIFLYYFSLTFSTIQALMKTNLTFIILSDTQFIAYHTYCFSQSLQVGII